ncbi:MAG: type II toxin-antitoxin system VapC family toxin [Bacillota bacterium]
MITETGREYFIDTSALLKAYIPEPGSENMERLLSEGAIKIISSMGLLETLSVFQRLHSVEKVLSRKRFDELCGRVLADVASGRIVSRSASPADIQEAIELELRQYLTAVDAIQIALARGAGNDVVFVSSDEKLNRIAGECGLTVWNPAEDRGQPPANPGSEPGSNTSA